MLCSLFFCLFASIVAEQTCSLCTHPRCDELKPPPYARWYDKASDVVPLHCPQQSTPICKILQHVIQVGVKARYTPVCAPCTDNFMCSNTRGDAVCLEDGSCVNGFAGRFLLLYDVGVLFVAIGTAVGMMFWKSYGLARTTYSFQPSSCDCSAFSVYVHVHRTSIPQQFPNDVKRIFKTIRFLKYLSLLLQIIACLGLSVSGIALAVMGFKWSSDAIRIAFVSMHGVCAVVPFLAPLPLIIYVEMCGRFVGYKRNEWAVVKKMKEDPEQSENSEEMTDVVSIDSEILDSDAITSIDVEESKVYEFDKLTSE